MRPRRILLLDSFQDFADMLSSVLRARGFTVRIAPTPKAGRAACESFRPDVILFDPAIATDAVALTRMLRLTAGAGTRIAALVLDRVPDGLDQIDASLLKPFNLQELFDLIDTWFPAN